MEFLSLSRRRFSARKVLSGEERGETAAFAGNHSFTSGTVQIQVHINLSDMWRSSFKISAAQLCSVTEIAPKPPFFCVNRCPFPVWFSCRCKSYQVQRLKKVVSNNPGVVNFATGLVNSVINLPDGIMWIVPGPHRTPASYLFIKGTYKTNTFALWS